MAVISYDCGIKQGFDMSNDTQEIVGFVTKLKIAGQKIKANLTVGDPMDVNNKVTVCGVMSSIHWDGGVTDPTYVNCQISNVNQKIVGILLHKDLSDTPVEIDYIVYKYDLETKKYFKCLHTNEATVKGILSKTGKELELYIDSEASNEVVSPPNFSLSVGILPESDEQTIHVALSQEHKFAKAFGLAN